MACFSKSETRNGSLHARWPFFFFKSGSTFTGFKRFSIIENYIANKPRQIALFFNIFK